MTFLHDDTIIAPATVPGSGAISVIRISGPSALTLTDILVTFKSGKACEASGNVIKFGTIYDGESLLDEVLVNIYRAPHSYTGEESAELMCHASSYIVSRILQLALSSGARLAQPGEFTQRAFLAGKLDLSQAEAVADLIASNTEASHRLSMQQMKGGYSSELASLRAQLLELTSLLELEMDFSEEDVEFADRQKLFALIDKVLARIDLLTESFKRGNAIKNGIPVAIVGPTNAGKSTLLNRIIGDDRAIVSEIEGTTRDTIEECFNIGGSLFRFIDTAGIRKTEGLIENIGIERSFKSIKEASIVIFLLDALKLSISSDTSSSYISESNALIKQVVSSIDFNDQRLIFALNKVDSDAKIPDNIFVSTKNIFVSCIENKGFSSTNTFSSCMISAKSGLGLEELEKSLISMQNSLFGSISDSSITVSNLRHYEALISTANYLSKARSSLASGYPIDLVSEDLRQAIASLGTITGQITNTEVLENIFKNFCIGK